jgi:hypothetical protein
MPLLKNCPADQKIYYTENGNTPRNLGWSAKYLKEGTGKTGRDGNKYVVKGGRWVLGKGKGSPSKKSPSRKASPRKSPSRKASPRRSPRGDLYYTVQKDFLDQKMKEKYIAVREAKGLHAAHNYLKEWITNRYFLDYDDENVKQRKKRNDILIDLKNHFS